MLKLTVGYSMRGLHSYKRISRREGSRSLFFARQLRGGGGEGKLMFSWDWNDGLQSVKSTVKTIENDEGNQDD